MSSRSGYAAPGRRLVREVVAQLKADGLEPDARDRQLLDVAARLVDRMAVLQGLVEVDGERAVSSTGIVRLHPAIGELRQHAIALSKTLAAIALSETTGGAGVVKDAAKQRAAATRWRAHNAAKAAGPGGAG